MKQVTPEITFDHMAEERINIPASQKSYVLFIAEETLVITILVLMLMIF